MTSSGSSRYPWTAILSWLLFVGWAGVVLWASLDAAPFRPLVRAVSWDKLQHALAYALLTLFGGLALRTFLSRRPLHCWSLALGFSLVYGAAVETIQHFMTSSRRGDLADLLADAVGALLVFGLAMLAERLRRAA